MGPLVEVDAELCVGSGECVAIAPEAFTLEPSDLTATVLPEAGSVSLERLHDAASQCPTGAIRVDGAT